MTKVLEQFASPKLIDVFKEALEDPNRHLLAFIFSANVAEIYGIFASKELERISNLAPETRLPCEHTVEEHREALEPIVKVTEAEIASN